MTSPLLRRAAGLAPTRTLDGNFSLLLCAALWGGTFVLVKEGVANQPLLSFNAWRFFLASLVLLALTHRRVRRMPAGGWAAGAVLGGLLALGYTFQALGLERTSVSHAGFITGSFVVFIPVIGVLFLHRRPTRAVMASVVLVCAGLALLTGVGGEGDALGDGYVLLCAVAWSLMILYTERSVRRFDWLSIVAVQTIWCGLACGAVALVSGPIEAPEGATQWGSMLVIVLIATIAAPALQAHGQRRVPAERAGLLLATQPVFATIAGYAAYSERLTPAGWAGCALIMGALLLVSRGEPPQTELKPEPRQADA